MSRSPVLVGDDDLEIRRMIKVLLGGKGYRVDEACDAHEAGELIKRTPPDVVLLDWMMPGVSGWDLARRLRVEQATHEIPIIMLTAKTDEESILAGFDAGADDYVTKPFSARELLARIDAVLRRTHTRGDAKTGRISVGKITLDPSEHRLLIDGREIEVSPTDFKLLYFFMRRPNKVFSRTQILDGVWGNNTYVEERTVDVQIRRLRKALGRCHHDQVIETVRGIGYRLKVNPDTDELS